MAQVQTVPTSTKKRERSKKSFDNSVVPTPALLAKKNSPLTWAPEPSPGQWDAIKLQEFTTPPADPNEQPATGSLGGKRSKQKHLDRSLPRPSFEHEDDSFKRAICVQALFTDESSSTCPSPEETTPKATPDRAILHVGDVYFSPSKPPQTVIRTRPLRLTEELDEDKTPPSLPRPLSMESMSEERGSRFELPFGDRESFSLHRGSISRGPRESTKFENFEFREYDYQEDVDETPEIPVVAPADFVDCVTPSPQVASFDWSNPQALLSRSPSSSNDPMRSPTLSYRAALRSPRSMTAEEFPGSPRSVHFSCSFRPIKDTPGPKLHPERQRSLSLLSLVPEMEAFTEREHLQQVSQTAVKKKKPREPPPTPLPHRLSRQNSLYDDKLLLMNFQALNMDASLGEEHSQGRIFATEFCNHRQVGSGAFFDVFRVEQRRKSKTFAVKRSKRPFRSKRDRSEYLREIQMVSRLELHRNIITYYRAWQEELHFLIQMEYCHSNLSDFVNGRTLSERFLWDCFQQIAQGLSHVHKGGLIHLDIKPENILVDLKGQRVHPVYKLGDFGQARLPDHWADGSEGDSQYVAPEVISKSKGGADPTAAADIFSLGLLMFELSSRYALPKNGDLWHDLRSGSASQELPIAMAKVQCLELKGLIMRCLEPNPTERISADAIVGIASAHLQKREGGSC